MSSFRIFDIAGSGMSAQSVRLNTVASNLANAESVSGDPAQVYRAKHPVFQAVQPSAARAGRQRRQGAGSHGIRAEPQRRYEPGNPLADPEGYVYAPSVNVVEEMVDMISASRAYQNDVEVMNTARNLMLATLKLGQG